MRRNTQRQTEVCQDASIARCFLVPGPTSSDCLQGNRSSLLLGELSSPCRPALLTPEATECDRMGVFSPIRSGHWFTVSWIKNSQTSEECFVSPRDVSQETAVVKSIP